jgi:hypothetical protein
VQTGAAAAPAESIAAARDAQEPPPFEPAPQGTPFGEAEQQKVRIGDFSSMWIQFG